jgi:ATP/maltotriose-dependent transcriptional regulator MalT
MRGRPARRVDDLPPGPVRSVPFVGRDVQLGWLAAEMEEVAANRLRVGLLLGDAGVGKTRLASEFVARQGNGVLALSARAYPLGATASLGLWVEALERKLRTFSDVDLLDLCAGHVEDLAALLPSVSAAARIQPDGERPRIRLLGALARLLQGLSERCPIIVTLDDIHLADGSSWEALNFLSRNLVDAPLFLLLAARPAELREHSMAGEVVRALEQEGLLTRITIGPLPPDDVRLLAAKFVEGPVPESLVEWLEDRAQGSPLFVTGLLRALLDEGGDLFRPSLQSLPEDLADRVHARLHDLDTADRALLELLTVIGYRAELSDLLRLSGRGLDDLGAALERLQRARLVSEIEDGRELVYEITHPLVQEAIYDQIGGARRRALHRHAARVLAEAGRHGAAASHVVEAADPGDDEAIRTLCEALRRAEAGEHHREVLALLEALLTMIPPGDGRWRGVVDVMPLTPEWVVDHRADAAAEVGVRAMRRADQVLQRSSDAAHQAAVKFSLGSFLAWGVSELEAGRELVETARRLFLDAGDEHAALLATNELGYHLGMADDGSGHERIAREVLAVAESRDDDQLRLQALCSLAWFLNLAGRFEEALPIIERALVIAAAHDKVYRRSYLLGMKASVQSLLGDRRAHEELQVAAELNQAYRDTLILDFAAQIAWESGDLQRAVAAAVDQIAWDGGVSVRRAFGVGMAVMSLAEMGRLDEARELQATVDGAFRGRSCWVLSRLADWSRAVVSELSGDRRAAIAPLLKVAEDAVANQYWAWGRWMLADLAESAVYARDRARADRALGLLLSDPCRPAGAPHEGVCSFVAGAASAAAGDFAGAAAHLRDAVTRFQTAGWRLFEGRALALLGTSLARRDRPRAIDALEQAAARFDACEAAVRRQEVLAILAGLGSRGRRKRTDLVGPGALSARERQVAALASKGFVAREIADQLFIGERTVETHLANIYAKLGITSKLDLIRRAGELDI